MIELKRDVHTPKHFHFRKREMGCFDVTMTAVFKEKKINESENSKFFSASTLCLCLLRLIPLMGGERQLRPSLSLEDRVGSVLSSLSHTRTENFLVTSLPHTSINSKKKIGFRSLRLHRKTNNTARQESVKTYNGDRSHKCKG